MLWYIIGAIVLIILGRFWYYWREVLFLRELNKTYGSFWHEYLKLPGNGNRPYVLDPGHPALEKITKLKKSRTHFARLLENAGFGKMGVVEQKRIGTATYRTTHKISEMLDKIEEKYLTAVLESFDPTIGYYEDRAKESFDPLYWVLLVLRSPKLILEWSAHLVRTLICGMKA